MGFGFVILLQLIALSIFCGIIAGIAIVIINIFSSPEKRRRYILFASIFPFIGLHTFYFLGLIGSGIISEIKKVDIGIGDSWYVPLPNNCRLSFGDITEYAYLDKNGEPIISNITQFQQIENQVFGKTKELKYFSFNTLTNELKKFSDEQEFIASFYNVKPKLLKAIDFYIIKRNEIAGFGYIIVGIISLTISLTILYILRLVIIKKSWY
jgi:hypothetical protein